MSIFTIEDSIDLIKTYLTDNLGTKLDELDTEYGDFELDDIRAWYVAELTSVPGYPVGIECCWCEGCPTTSIMTS